jgi:hypothetical protein
MSGVNSYKMMKMMNKKAEHFAFGVSFLAVLASFMLIVAPTLVAAPQFFPPFPPIEPPFHILLNLDCADYGGACKAACAANEQPIGAANAENLNCAAKCCKKKNTCNTDIDPFSVPCFNSNDCGQDHFCNIVGKDKLNRCCLEEQVTICRNPGKKNQHTETIPAHAFRALDVGEYKMGTCCEQKQECIRVNGITQKPGCQEGFRCEQRGSSIEPTCCYPIETPVPTSTPTETPVPTDTPQPTETPSPTNTPVPTLTPIPTSTPAPTSTPTTSPTSAPTMTPVPTGSPSPSPSVTP